jgi:hypothetical protein
MKLTSLKFVLPSFILHVGLTHQWQQKVSRPRLPLDSPATVGGGSARRGQPLSPRCSLCRLDVTFFTDVDDDMIAHHMCSRWAPHQCRKHERGRRHHGQTEPCPRRGHGGLHAREDHTWSSRSKADIVIHNFSGCGLASSRRRHDDSGDPSHSPIARFGWSMCDL